MKTQVPPQPHLSQKQPHTRVSWGRMFPAFSQVHPSLLSLSPALCLTGKQSEMMRTTCQQGCRSRLLAWGRLGTHGSGFGSPEWTDTPLGHSDTLLS